MAEKAIFTNMCMVYDTNGNILVQNRQNPNWPGITFPGGHVNAEETFLDSTIREIKEETGLDISNLQLCGLKQFTLEDGTRYVVILYKTTSFSGDLISSVEGEVFWIPQSELHKYPLAKTFDKMFEVFIKDELSECFYVLESEDNWVMQVA